MRDNWLTADRHLHGWLLVASRPLYFIGMLLFHVSR
jgi:hypothetical protein